MRTTGLLLAFLALITVGALGQTPPTRWRSGGGTVSPKGGSSATAYMDPAPAILPPPVTSAPYSGEEIVESTETLGDGTHITRNTPGLRVYRDSLGRTRVERPILRASPLMPAVDLPPIVEITDPAAGVLYVLDVQHRVAYRSMFQTQRPPERNAVSASRGRPMAPLPQGTEPLGTQTIDGVVVEGIRTTQTIAGAAQGLDHPVVVTTETWTSPELRVTLLRKTTDPRTGESVFRIRNFTRAEPDGALFLPPAGYEIREQPGPFSITYTKQ